MLKPPCPLVSAWQENFGTRSFRLTLIMCPFHGLTHLLSRRITQPGELRLVVHAPSFSLKAFQNVSFTNVVSACF